MRGILFGLVTLTAVVACSGGGGSTGGGSGPVSSVDASKSASSLSDAESAQYCQDLQAFYASHAGELKRLACAIGAAFSSIAAKTDDEAKTLCRKAYDDCLASPDKGEGTSPKDCAEVSGKLKACAATIGALDQCVTDQFAQLASVNADTICAAAKAPGASTNPPASASPIPLTQAASCQGIQSSCPNVFGTDERADLTGEPGDAPGKQ